MSDLDDLERFIKGSIAKTRSNEHWSRLCNLLTQELEFTRDSVLKEITLMRDDVKVPDISSLFLEAKEQCAALQIENAQLKTELGSLRSENLTKMDEKQSHTRTLEDELDRCKRALTVREQELLKEIQMNQAIASMRMDELESSYQRKVNDLQRELIDVNNKNSKLRSELCLTKEQCQQRICELTEKLQNSRAAKIDINQQHTANKKAESNKMHTIPSSEWTHEANIVSNINKAASTSVPLQRKHSIPPLIPVSSNNNFNKADRSSSSDITSCSTVTARSIKKRRLYNPNECNFYITTSNNDTDIQQKE